MHSIDDFVDLDHIIDYSVMKYDVEYADPVDESKVDDDKLLAYMPGQKSSCADFYQVLVSKQSPDKNKRANENTPTPSSGTIDGLSYYLNKREALNFQGNKYSAHMTTCHYCVGQHIFQIWSTHLWIEVLMVVSVEAI
jgi:hypothetical protein